MSTNNKIRVMPLRIVPVPFKDGERVTVRGRILMTEEVSRCRSMLPLGWVMLVRVDTEDGGVFWLRGTRPESICDAWPGAVVTFRATISKERDRQALAYFKRPTRAAVIQKPQPLMVEK